LIAPGPEAVDGPVEDVDRSRVQRPADVLGGNPDRQIVEPGVAAEVAGGEGEPERVVWLVPAEDAGAVLGPELGTTLGQSGGRAVHDAHRAGGLVHAERGGDGQVVLGTVPEVSRREGPAQRGVLARPVQPMVTTPEGLGSIDREPSVGSVQDVREPGVVQRGGRADREIGKSIPVEVAGCERFPEALGRTESQASSLRREQVITVRGESHGGSVQHVHPVGVRRPDREVGEAVRIEVGGRRVGPEGVARGANVSPHALGRRLPFPP
jgi:hypothetical protein